MLGNNFLYGLLVAQIYFILCYFILFLFYYFIFIIGNLLLFYCYDSMRKIVTVIQQSDKTNYVVSCITIIESVCVDICKMCEFAYIFENFNQVLLLFR